MVLLIYSFHYSDRGKTLYKYLGKKHTLFTGLNHMTNSAYLIAKRNQEIHLIFNNHARIFDGG
jgi:hypothetical protein